MKAAKRCLSVVLVQAFAFQERIQCYGRGKFKYLIPKHNPIFIHFRIVYTYKIGCLRIVQLHKNWYNRSCRPIGISQVASTAWNGGFEFGQPNFQEKSKKQRRA